MRLVPLLTLTLLLVSTAAAADPLATAEEPRKVEVDVERLDGRVAPGGALVERRVSFEVPCEFLLDPGSDVRPVHLQVSDAPPWVAATVTPSTVYLRDDACDARRNATVNGTSTLVLGTTFDAPAFHPQRVFVTARVDDTDRTGTGNVSVEASFFNRVHASLAKGQVGAGPGEAIQVPLTVRNLGNDNVTVIVNVESPPDGFHTPRPPPLLVLSKQQGGHPTATRDLELTTPRGGLHTDRHDVVQYVLTVRHFQDPTLDTATERVQLSVHTQGFNVPAPHPLLALGLLGLAARAWTRRTVG